MKAFLSLLAILWNSAFRWVYLSFSPLPLASLLFLVILRPAQTAILPFCISFSWGWFWSLLPVQCHEPLFIILQALCLSDLIPWIYLLLPLYNHKRFDLSQMKHLLFLWFSLLLQYKLGFCNKEFMVWATVSSRSCFCWLYWASPYLAAKNIIWFCYWASGDVHV